MPLSQSPGSDSLSWLVGTLNPRSLDGTIGHMWFDPDVRRFSTASQVQGFVGGPHAGEPVNHAQRPVLENSRSQVRDIARAALLTCLRAPHSPGSDSLSWLEGTLRPRRLDDTIGHMWFDPDVRLFSTASQVQDLLGGPHGGEPVNHAQRPVLEDSRSQVRDTARAALLTCLRASESGAVPCEMDIWAAMPLSQGQGEDALNDRMLSKMQRFARKIQERNGVGVRHAFRGNRDDLSA